MEGRQGRYADLIAGFLAESSPDAIHLDLLRDVVRERAPELLDDELTGAGELKWRYDVRWAVEKLVQAEPPRAVRLGDGLYRAATADEAWTVEQAVDRLTAIRTAFSPDGTPRPHKPLLVLLALSDLENDVRRWQYDDVARRLGEWLTQVTDTSSPSPETPFWRLQNDGLWQVATSAGLLTEKYPASSDPPIGALREAGVSARLIAPFEALVAPNAEARARCVAAVLHRFFLDKERMILDATVRTIAPSLADRVSALLGPAPSAWVFQAMPEQWNLVEHLENGDWVPGHEDTWTAAQHAARMRVGDTVALWQAGKDGGVYALGRLTGEAALGTRPDYRPGGGSQEMRVPFVLTEVVDPPVLRSDLKSHPVLKDLSIMRFAQGTNFEITPEHWTALMSEIHTPVMERYFLLSQHDQTTPTDYPDVEGQQYVFRKTVAGRKKLVDAGAGQFVYYRPGAQQLLGHGRVRDVAEIEPHAGVQRWKATLGDYVAFPNPVAKSDAGFSWNHQNSIVEITKQQFDQLVALGRGDAMPEDQVKFDLPSLKAAVRDARLLIPDDVLAAVLAALRSGKHLMLTGPPGTAKTTLAQLVAQLAASAGETTGYTLTTATSDWTTYDTIGGLRPSNDGLEFAAGHLLDAIISDEWLVIDELNRSNFDRAFGQLFTVLSGQSVTLPYRHPDDGLPITLRSEVEGGGDAEEHTIIVPQSWRIIATINVFDKSLLFEMSFALMRRFAFVEVPAPSKEVYSELIERELTTASSAVRSQATATLQRLLAVRGVKEIGPAIAIDLARFCRHRLELGPVDGGALVLQGFYSFLLPQFEGIADHQAAQLASLLAPDLSAVQRRELRTMLETVLGVSLGPVANSAEADTPEDEVDNE